VQRDELAHQGQAQSRAGVLAGNRGVNPLKGFEDALMVLSRDADAVMRYRDM
jgi:hypothetical protein